MPIVYNNVEKNDKIPKYRMIKESIVSSILSGKISPDEQLPTEYELMERYGLSRVTVRRALDELYDEGYIYRIKGKGTFCSKNSEMLPKNQREDLGYSGYKRLVERHNRKHTRVFVMLKTEPCPQKDAEVLQIEPGTSVFVLDRIHCVDDKPWVYVRGIMHPENARGFEAYNPANVSLYDIAYNYFGGILEARDKQIYVVGATSELAHYMEVEEGFPLIACDYTSYLRKDSSMTRFESAHAFYRTDVLSYLPDYV